jgi:hypothetical protein
VSTTIFLRRPGVSEKHLYVIGRISGDGESRVLCVTSGPSVKTLPVFTKQEAARRLLRASPYWFNLLGLGCRTREISKSEAGALLGRCPDGIQGIALDPSPETLFEECAAESWAEVI